MFVSVFILAALDPSFASAAPETFRTYLLLHPISLDDELVMGLSLPNNLTHTPPNRPADTPFSSGLNIRSAAFHSVPVRKGIIIYTHASVMRNQNQSAETTYLVPHGDPNYGSPFYAYWNTIVKRNGSPELRLLFIGTLGCLFYRLLLHGLNRVDGFAQRSQETLLKAKVLRSTE